MDLKNAVEMTQKQLEIDKQISGIELEGEKVEALETILSFCQSVIEANRIKCHKKRHSRRNRQGD